MKKNNYPSKKNNAKPQRVSNFTPRQGGKKEDYAKVNGGVFVYSKPVTVAEIGRAHV